MTETSTLSGPSLADVERLVEAMDQLLDDMGHNGLSVCLAAKIQARIAFEPFVDEEARKYYMPIEKARELEQKYDE